MRREKHRLGAIALLFAVGAGSVTNAADDPAAQGGICVQAEIGGVGSPAYFDCLNAELRQNVRRQTDRQAALNLVVDQAAPSSPNEAGIYNQTAIRQRLGSAFGHGVVPQRPPLIYRNPLIPPPPGK